MLSLPINSFSGFSCSSCTPRTANTQCHSHEPADGIAGNWQSLHIRGTRLLQGWLDRLAIMGEQWLGGAQQDSRLQMVDRGLELMLIGLWRCAQRRYPSHDAELEPPWDGRTPRK
uniref:Uncharacterized protein n=1 Tax=Oryza barthii TaxID=65489 RepID=A0A0D3EPK3_9ORYZ